MLQKTKGIVMRSVKYGETSLIVTMFTELFGIQSYLLNGVRTTKPKNSFQPGQFQPSAVLELIVYHQEKKNLQRIKECKWAILYEHIFQDMYKNAVALFMVEMLQKCLKQPDPQPDLFYFMEDALNALDKSSPVVNANFPIFFALHLSHFFGFRMEDDYSLECDILDLKEGEFVSIMPDHQQWVGKPVSEIISGFLKAQQPADTGELRLNQETRRSVLDACLRYYAFHTTEFGQLKSLPVLQSIFG
jgi:DNA repair protein RecO (recombination protein O)